MNSISKNVRAFVGYLVAVWKCSYCDTNNNDTSTVCRICGIGS